MQQHILFAFKKVLLSAPSLIDVFRAEGVWDFIFSENFFYFGPAPAEYFGDNSSRNEVSLLDDGGFYDSMNFEDVPSAKEVEPIQVEVISFMEFAATLSGSSHNLVGSSSILFDVAYVRHHTPLLIFHSCSQLLYNFLHLSFAVPFFNKKQNYIDIILPASLVFYSLRPN